jgi:hypothetical protein
MYGAINDSIQNLSSLTFPTQRDKSMLTFEAQPFQGAAVIVEKLSVRGI